VLGRCCCSWALVHGVVLSCVCCWWGGAGSGPSSSPLVGWCWAVVVIHGHWFMGWCWAVFAIGGVVLVVGHCCCHWWGGAGLLSLFMGAVLWVVVLGHVCHSWGGAGPGSSSLMLGVVMGHRLGGWWWALIAIHVDTLLLCSIMVMVMVAIRPSLSCCVGSKSDDKQ